MAKYRVLLSDKVYIQEEIEADSLEEARKKAQEEFANCFITEDDGTKTPCYEMNEWEADLLPREKHYFRIESVEPVEPAED